MKFTQLALLSPTPAEAAAEAEAEAEAEAAAVPLNGPASGADSEDFDFHTALRNFQEFGKTTQLLDFPDPSVTLPVYVNEYWTSKQRAAHSLHEVSYRACFKPQLPRFFIERLTQKGDTVYDPFMGRGTTILEAALLGRVAIGCDINPISRYLVQPRLTPPTLEQVAQRFKSIELETETSIPDDLLAFYHPTTLKRICNLRQYLLERQDAGGIDVVDAWIRMVATNRLTGHSPGFFSVYSLPPNQAVSSDTQRKINLARNQTPPDRNVVEIILRKTKSLLSKLHEADHETLQLTAEKSLLLNSSCDSTPAIDDDSVQLVVTSPPFLDVVDYRKDNWLRCWFNGVDSEQVPIWQLKRADQWQAKMTGVFRELRRVLRPGGFVAFEVGEVRGGKLLLETLVVPAATDAGLVPLLALVNDQAFTKTANCWGVSNLTKGTNTNRIVLLQKQ